MLILGNCGYICLYVYICVYVYICLYMSIYINICKYIYICKYICLSFGEYLIILDYIDDMFYYKDIGINVLIIMIIILSNISELILSLLCVDYIDRNIMIIFTIIIFNLT